MPTPIRENHAKRMLKNNELVLFETVGTAARKHGKAMGVGGLRQDFEFQTWLVKVGMRFLTGGSDVGYILSAGCADVKQLRGLGLS